ncbi:hypothetical protein QQZ08_007393 [Neonectria magnoliae]|uniref:Uncharacterized protein n=1 Tax=Neonectria magnoliae TaxID=2732573 RepID=A0ABR1HXS2_9HYPO
MDTAHVWALDPRGDHSSSPEDDGQSESRATGDVYTDALAEDLFQDKFMGLARGGSNGEKIMRGFLIGVAIGLIVACFTPTTSTGSIPGGRRGNGYNRHGYGTRTDRINIHRCAKFYIEFWNNFHTSSHNGRNTDRCAACLGTLTKTMA